MSKKENKNKEKEVPKYDRAGVENVMKRRFFVVPAFEIYNGIAGLYDYGPTGCALKNHIEQYWREHFILEENLLEISGTCLTPEIVLKTSGHVDKFTDFAVKDVKNGQCFRADKLIKEWIEKEKKKKKVKEERIKELEELSNQCENFDEKEIDEAIEKYKIKSPDTGNELSKSFKFNLMFQTQIGPTGGCKGFLRPETAQGHFVNFKHLLDFNSNRIPFGSASIGLGFRNEIAPRSGLLRVREFTMAEIEYFVDPLNKKHKKFHLLKEIKLPLWSAKNQQNNESIEEITLGEAVEKKIIDNEVLGYFIGKTYLFLIGIGIRKDGIRFRQHTPKEMAHYASDCWDAEIETSYGWVECAGHADRTCYDLSHHTKGSGTELVASRLLKETKVVKGIKITPNKGVIFKSYKDKKESAKKLCEKLDKLSEEEKEEYMANFEKTGKIEVEVDGEKFILDKEKNEIKMERFEQNIHEEKYWPSVIEPSFGIGRIVYCVLEHCFKVREKDARRTYFDFPPVVAPYKASILPLIENEEFLKFVEPIRKVLVQNGVSYKIDEIDSIGRRYARTDEIGVPFGITIDDITIKDNTVTLREIDTMKQIRVPIEEVGIIIKNVCNRSEKWEDIIKKYPAFEQPKKEKDN
jgi:glycyl-tRNA synthetase